ncbi:hypothetical protein [Mucilaginibacter pedocola]|uniref:Uncharacterized protein n=1 Tax=Mucilaginibacter pedocola TaxID=1792845 RepID=A0A1S9PHD9_9SPHI|nr:hypothetical protein [Mucilaginibacter pedocola]OOQ60329.1 hypothetical protein BC343_25220 [Mucilaginibacter pedocola]
MTFIASVVAKKGVAVIADSLVTSESPILHYDKFVEYLKSQPDNDDGDKLINPDKIMELFKYEPAFTKDFEEKLFEFDKFTAITTTGEAYVNSKNIADIIEEFRAENKAAIDDLQLPITEKINFFIDFINKNIKEHIGKFGSIGYLVFIITHYTPSTHKTTIYKAIIYPADTNTLEFADHDYVQLITEEDWNKVVCDGQNKISEKVLLGIGKELYDIFPTFVNNILSVLAIPKNVIPEDYIALLLKEQYFKDVFFNDVAMFSLNNLSLQQAVDLASLLMRLEVDFQKYTNNIPSVGGVIKLAVIDKEGFKFISGDSIEPPKHINY